MAVRRARAGAEPSRPIAVAGARELVPLLVKELGDGGDASAVSEGSARGAAVLVWIGKADEDALRAASLAHVPIVGVTGGESLPYVLDTNLVVVRPGEGLPVDAVARAIALVLADEWIVTAARLPVLRKALVREAVRRQARTNALAAAMAEPAAVLPVLVVAQMTLVEEIARAFRRASIPLVALAPATGLVTRALARAPATRIPESKLVRGVVAYASTRAVGEAAGWYFRN
jgi:hypothetical protein